MVTGYLATVCVPYEGTELPDEPVTVLFDRGDAQAIADARAKVLRRYAPGASGEVIEVEIDDARVMELGFVAQANL